MQDSNPLSEQGSARRRLIRGSFAVPALLTLHSGASMAGSSINGCLVRQNKYPVSQRVAGNDDVWFRYQLWGYVKTTGEVADQAGLWIRGSDLAVYDIGRNRVWLSGGAYQRFNAASNSLGQMEYSQPKGPAGCNWKRVNRWVSLRVDRYGNLTGAGSSGYGSAVADSCWNSFAIGART
ncbi:MAG: hypothetical protein KIT60_30175 [Burkholderiaceae bacterium]|nr:hypothetical protein [Burkholderiaceae bacterium]